MTAAALIVLVAALVLAAMVTLRLLDNWLSRRLDRAWDADPSTPIYEQTVKALRYRPGVGR